MTHIRIESNDLYSTSLLLLGWFLMHSNFKDMCVLTVPSTAAT